MSTSGKTELDYLIPEVWASDMYDELRKQLIVAPVFSREYEGEIRNFGDTVKVNQIIAPNGEILTDDKQTFSSETMQVNQFTITVNMRANAAFEFTSLAQLQSQAFENDAKEALVYAVQKKLEDQIIAALVPSGASPNHIIAPAAASDLDAVDVAGIRTLLSKQSVPKSNRWLFLDPDYYGDLLTKTTFTSSDFKSGQPVSSGEFSSPLYGFRIAEVDNLTADLGFGVHPSALQLVMQKELTLKISDLHSQKKHGYLMSADLVFGYSLFDNKRIVKITG